MDKQVMSLKNDFKIDLIAKSVANFIGRGSATTDKISATLSLLKTETGLKTLKDLQQSHIEKIIEKVQERTENGGSKSAANSYISSLNNIIKYVNNSDLHTIKASDYGLSRNIKENDGKNKENTREAASSFKNWLEQKYEQTKDIRYAALKQAVSIQSVNLRLRESLQIKLLQKDFSKDVLRINEKGDGSKNSRAREVKLSIEQKQALTEARQFLKDNKLKDLNIGTLKNGRDFANNALKAFRQATGQNFHFHGERHYQAHLAFKNAWQDKGYTVECRAVTGETKKDWESRVIAETGLLRSEFKKLDNEIRQEISRDLGHERLEITSRYLG